MQLTLDDLLKIPPNATPEHLMSLGLLQPPVVPPAPSMVPPATVTAKLSPVTSLAPPSAVKPMVLPHPAVPAPVAPELNTPPMSTPEAPLGAFKPMTPPMLNFKEREALPLTSPGVQSGTSQFYENKLERAEDQKQNPWGTAENHPGLFGKIGHIAARIGNIAGDVVAPGTMALIPGTDLNKRVEEGKTEKKLAGAEAEERAGAREKSEEELRSAEVEKMKKEALPGKTPEELTIHDLMTGDNGNPRVNPDTQKPYTYLEAYTAEKEAAAGAKRLPEGEQPLGEKVSQLNSALTRRYQVLHKGEQLPAEFTLPAKATQKDYDRIDKALESTEKATGTKAQIDEINASRHQAEQDRQESQKDKEKKEGHKLVIGTNPKTHEEEMMSAADADKRGLENIYEAPADTTNKALSARHFLPLVDNKDTANPGILQMIDVLDKRGELGTIASRWNEFLTGKLGAGDPDFEKLRVAMRLATTLLMNLHVGSRGGAYMMEHFEDAANAGKMNAQVLRAGVEQEEKYAKQRAMMPAQEEKAKSNFKAF